MSTLRENITKERLKALKNRDKARVNALKSVEQEIATAEITKTGRVVLSDEQVKDVVSTYAARLRKSITTALADAKNAGVDESKLEGLVTERNAEIAIVEEFLPKRLTEAEIRNLVTEAVANGASNIGAVMGALKNVEGLDKGLASKIARELV